MEVISCSKAQTARRESTWCLQCEYVNTIPFVSHSSRFSAFQKNWPLRERKGDLWTLCNHIKTCKARVVACIRDIMAGFLPW